MWTYICYSQVLLVLTYFIQERNTLDNKKYNRDERIFTDVIRNISRVNNILQELITNYEQLQKIYKSEENVEKDYSSDAEIDETFKSMKNHKNVRGRNIKKTRDKSKELDYFPATQIIWSDNDGTNDDSFEEPQKKSDNKSKSIKEIIKKEIYSNPETISEIVLANISEDSKEIKQYTNEEISKRDKILLVDMHNKQTTKVENELQFAVLNKRPESKFTKKISHKSITKIKKRNKKQNFNNIKLNHVSRQNNITKKIKRIVYAEVFSPKTIWNEILQNKPIQLKAHEDTVNDRKEPKYLINMKPNLRSVDGKTALVILTKNKKEEKQESSQSTEDEAKEIFKTNVLREAYGDACLKVVVKKCYKACKQVSKAVCVRYSCKSKFKEKFKEFSKTGCIKEFRAVSNNNKPSTSIRADFNDATRGGLLTFCHTHEQSDNKQQALRKGNGSTNAATKFDKELNILRDRYERACRRASTRKCVSVCNYAFKNTCDTYVCAKGLKKAYKKYCKRQCRTAYSKSGHGKSSSKSGSSSDTDSISSDTSFSHIR